MRINGCILLLALGLASTLASPTPKIREKKSLTDGAKLDEKEEPKIEEVAGSEKDRTKKSTASFCVHIRPDGAPGVQVPCDCQSQEPAPEQPHPAPQQPSMHQLNRIQQYGQPIYQLVAMYPQSQEALLQGGHKRPFVLAQGAAPSKGMIESNALGSGPKTQTDDRKIPLPVLEEMNAQQPHKHYGPMFVIPPNRMVYLPNADGQQIPALVDASSYSCASKNIALLASPEGSVRRIYQAMPYEAPMAYAQKPAEASGRSSMMNHWNANSMGYRNSLPLTSELMEQPQLRSAGNKVMDSYEPQGRSTIISVKGAPAPPVIYQQSVYPYPEMSLSVNPYPTKVYTHEIQMPAEIKTGTIYMREAAEPAKMVFQPDSSSQMGLRMTNNNAAFKLSPSGEVAREREALGRSVEREAELKEAKDEKKDAAEKSAN